MTALAHILSIASNFLAAISSALAAVFWYWASQVEPPNTLPAFAPSADLEFRTNGTTDFGNGANAFVDTAPLVKWAQQSGRRNKIAALWSAAAAAFTFLAWALGVV
jgi:hypothetical protein